MNSINEKDFSKSFNLNELYINNCNYLKFMKSDYIKKSYSQLLLASENNITFHKNLIKKTNSIYNKYYYSKLLVKHAELLKREIDKIEELFGYLCKNTKSKTINDLKHDLLILHIFEYQTYKNALNILSEIKIFYINLHKYDIEDQIDVLNYKTNLAGIEYLKTKLSNNNMLNETKRVEEILSEYKNTHDDNLLNEIIEIEKKTKIEEFTNIKYNTNYINIILFLILIMIFFYFCNSNNINLKN